MSEEISQDKAALVLDRLMKQSVPILAVFRAADETVTKLYGFLDNIATDGGIVVSSTQGMPMVSSCLSVPMGKPVGTGCRFFIEMAPDADLQLKYGDKALRIQTPTNGRLMLFYSGEF